LRRPGQWFNTGGMRNPRLVQQFSDAVWVYIRLRVAVLTSISRNLLTSSNARLGKSLGLLSSAP